MTSHPTDLQAYKGLFYRRNKRRSSTVGVFHAFERMSSASLGPAATTALYFADELGNFPTYILDVLLFAYCFAGNLSESRSRNFSCENLTILKGMEKIVAAGQNQGWKIDFFPGGYIRSRNIVR